MPKISHIIFDWDGTVMDSAHKIVHCMQQAAILSDLPIPSAAQVHHVIGISLVQAIELVFDISKQHAQSVSQHYKDVFLNSDHISCDLFEGAHTTLDALSTNYVLGVATGKARRGLLRAFNESNSGHYFDKTRCADDQGVLSKPDPSMLLQLISQWDIKPENALMIGDTVYDMQMAEAINMPRVGVSYGVHHKDEIAKHAPIEIIDKLPQLINLVKQHSH